MCNEMKGLILCAGRGKRLYPISEYVPKSLVPIVNKPIIYYGIEALIKSGIKKIAIVINNEQSEIKDYVEEEFKDVEINFIIQREAKGTGDAILCCKDFIGNSPFIVYLGDNIYQYSLSDLVREYTINPAHAYVTVKQVNNPSDYGIVSVINNEVTLLQEKPRKPLSNNALTGVYIFGTGMINEFENLIESPNGEIEMTMAVKNMIEKELTVKPFQINGWWVDIGTPERYLLANRLKINTALVENISHEAVIENSIINQPVSIEKGTVIKNSVIGPNTSIGANSYIVDSYVNNSIIFSNVEIKNERIDQIVRVASNHTIKTIGLEKVINI